MKVYNETQVTNGEMLAILAQLGFVETPSDPIEYRMQHTTSELYLVMPRLPRSCQVFLTPFKSITYAKNVRLPVKAGQAVRFFKSDTYYSLRLRRALADARFNPF